MTAARKDSQWNNLMAKAANLQFLKRRVGKVGSKKWGSRMPIPLPDPVGQEVQKRTQPWIELQDKSCLQGRVRYQK